MATLSSRRRSTSCHSEEQSDEEPLFAATLLASEGSLSLAVLGIGMTWKKRGCMRWVLLFGGLLTTMAMGQSPPPDAAQPGTVALPPELARVLTDYEKAWRAHDAAGLVALFTDDGFVLSSGAPPVRGRAAIAKAYANAGGDLVLHAFAFATEGPLGYIVGGFSRREGEPDVGKFTLTLRRGADGKWLIVSDMDNGNARSR
jgi:ketosteroid isomerase-like protein